VQKIISGDSRNDLALQAKAYCILARTSTIGRKPLDAYKMAIELSAGTADRIDYILEAAQWMSAYGLSRTELSDMLLSALEDVYERDRPASHVAQDTLHGRIVCVGPQITQKHSMTMLSSRLEGSGGVMVSRSYTASSTGERRSSTLLCLNEKERRSRGGSIDRSRDRSRDRSIDGDTEKNNDSTSTVDMNSKDCEQAVRTCLMLALLQCNEKARLDR
jgi:hypothetical protein